MRLVPANSSPPYTINPTPSRESPMPRMPCSLGRSSPSANPSSIPHTGAVEYTRAVFAAVVRLTPRVKTVWVRVMPTTPRPSTGRKSSRRRRLSGSVGRISKSSRRPARVKHVASKRMGGTLSTTILTTVKLVPKKKTVKSSAASTAVEDRRFGSSSVVKGSPRLTDQVRLRAEGLYVGGDHTCAVLDVFYIHDLVGRVHVAVGARDESCRDAGPRELYGVRISTCRARVGLQGVRDVLALRRSDKAFREDGRDVRRPLYKGAAAQGVISGLVLGDAGSVRGVGHVDGDGRGGVEPEGSPAGAVETYLLLHAGHGHDFGTDIILLGEQPQCLEHHECAHAIVHRAGGQTPVRKLHEVMVDYANVPNPDHASGVFGVIGAYVDPEALYVGDLLALIGLHNVDGLLADHTGHFAVLREQPDALSHKHLGVPATDAGKAEQAVLLYVGDHHPDLVYVPG